MAEFKFIEDTLSQKYSSINQSIHPWNELIRHTSVSMGWYDLVIELIQKIEIIYKNHNADINDFHIDEVKEKYGGLRVDARSSLIEVHDLISLYENKSEEICEQCGREGKIREDLNWIMCLCEDCYRAGKENLGK